MSIVLFGVVSGADLGAAGVRPDVRGALADAARPVVPWLAAGVFTVVGLAISFGVRPDPKQLSQTYAVLGQDRSAAAPLREILRRPRVGTAMVAAVGSFAVMVGVMNLAGYVAVGHHHAQSSIFTIISLHIVGMYGSC